MSDVSDDFVAPPEAEQALKLLLEAIRAEDYEAYLAPGCETFRQGISRELFFDLSRQIAPRLKAGYATEFLSEINRCEHRVFLWKLGFSDGADQFVARLALTSEGQVTGFMLN